MKTLGLMIPSAWKTFVFHFRILWPMGFVNFWGFVKLLFICLLLKSFLCFCQCWELISHYLFKDCFCSILSLPYFQSSDMCQTLVELPGGTLGKEPTCQCKSHKTHGFNPWVKKIPGRRRYQPIPVFLPREFHGQKSLVGYSPWGLKESDTTEVI